MSHRFTIALLGASSVFVTLLIAVPFSIYHMFLALTVVFCMLIAVVKLSSDALSKSDVHTESEPRIIVREPNVQALRAQWRMETQNAHAVFTDLIKTMQDGNYIYIIRDVDVTGNYKIGRATSPSKRLYDFGVRLPFEVRIVYVAAVSNAHAVEQTLHNLYKDQRISGEWFKLSNADIEAIKEFTQSA